MRRHPPTSNQNSIGGTKKEGKIKIKWGIPANRKERKEK
jgi:hypothetical protein